MTIPRRPESDNRDRALVVGVDAGGTTTRCLVAADDGAAVGWGRAEGANQNSSGGDLVAHLSAALRRALRGVDPSQVRGGVFGMAGAGDAGRAKANDYACQAWEAAWLPGRPSVVTDIGIAFAAGTAEPDGLVLLAGTGAGAAALRDRVEVRRADGYGWLLGDEGSAVWLGREALRAAVAACDGRGEPTRLTGDLARALLGDDHPPGGDPLAQGFVRWAHSNPPAEMGRLAPLVGTAAQDGDAVAGRVVEDAAARLLATVDVVRQALPATPAPPTVVAGGLLRAPGPMADRVLTGLRTRLGRDPILATEGAVGAAALALHHAGASPEVAVAAHRALLATSPPW